MKRECQRCEFYKTAKDARMGLCKRNPPAPIFMGMQMESVSRRQVPLVLATFPTMDRDDWCGEFRERRSKEEGQKVEIDWSKLKPHGETQ